MKNPKFNREEEVYHVTPESPKGIIIDIQYLFSTNEFSYLVAFNPLQVSLWYSEFELSKDKKFS